MRRVTLVLTSLFMLSIVPGTAIAQESIWTDMAPATGPSARGAHEMAYDAESDRIVLFGGTTDFASGFMDDTWAYDFNANTWTERNPGTRPSPRWGHAMAYDAGSDRVILYGGTVNSPETWAYDYNADTWTNRSPSIQPGPWSFADMAYDALSDRIVLFGGCAGSELTVTACPPAANSDETWVYDYTANTWTDMRPGTSPLARLFHRMAYDKESDRVILFGGILAPGATREDTWAYDFRANSWTEMNPPETPFRRSAHSMAYDANADRIVLFGGSSVSFTWTYDFNSDIWSRTEIETGPSRRDATSLAYDTESDRTVLFGGFTSSEPFAGDNAETWAHQLVPPPLLPPDSLLYLVIGVVAAAVVALVAVYMTRRRRKMRQGEGGE